MAHNLKIGNQTLEAVEKITAENTGGSTVEFITPAGSKTITANGTHDVTNYASAAVNVPLKYFATGTVSNVTAGQKLTVTGIKDATTGATFTPKGVLAYVEVSSNTTLYPANHKSGTPAIFCFVRDFDKGFGVGMACFSTGETAATLREVRLNSDIGGVSNPSNTHVSVSGNSFTYMSVTNSMWGLLAASKWRWAAWG